MHGRPVPHWAPNSPSRRHRNTQTLEHAPAPATWVAGGRRRVVIGRGQERAEAEQKGLAGTPAHGSGMVGSVGSGRMLILVCFG